MLVLGDCKYIALFPIIKFSSKTASSRKFKNSYLFEFGEGYIGDIPKNLLSLQL
jgi:hypothetical protein